MTKEQYAALTEELREILNAKRRSSLLTQIRSLYRRRRLETCVHDPICKGRRIRAFTQLRNDIRVEQKPFTISLCVACALVSEICGRRPPLASCELNQSATRQGLLRLVIVAK